MSDTPTDFNDLAALAGPEAVKATVDKVIADAAAAASQAWPDPILPGTVPTPEIPPSILPTWLGAMAGAVAQSTQTPPTLAVMVGLSVLAAVLQRRYEVAPFADDYTEPLSIWTCCGMDSGSRKSAVFSAMTAALLAWEKFKYDQGLAERSRVASARKVAEKRIERLLVEAGKATDEHERERIRAEIQHEKDTMPAELRAPRIFTEDVTPERLQAMLAEYGERMALLSDEAGIFQILAGMYSGGSSAWRFSRACCLRWPRCAGSGIPDCSPVSCSPCRAAPSASAMCAAAWRCPSRSATTTRPRSSGCWRTCPR